MVNRSNKQKKLESLSREDIFNSIKSAYQKLIDKDSYLLEIDANERSIEVNAEEGNDTRGGETYRRGNGSQ